MVTPQLRPGDPISVRVGSDLQFCHSDLTPTSNMNDDSITSKA